MICLQAASAWYDRDCYPQALVAVSLAMLMSPDEPSDYRSRALCFNKLGAFERAISDCDHALRSQPESKLTLATRASSLAAVKRFKEAAVDLGLMLAIDPYDADTYKQRGSCRALSAQYDEAIVDFDRALEFGQTGANVYYSRGWCLFQLKKYSNAIDDFDRAIESDTSKPFHYQMRGLAYMATHQYARALDDADAWLRIEPDCGDAYFMRHQARLMLGQYAAAHEDFVEASRLNPKLIKRLIKSKQPAPKQSASKAPPPNPPSSTQPSSSPAVASTATAAGFAEALRRLTFRDKARQPQVTQSDGTAKEKTPAAKPPETAKSKRKDRARQLTRLAKRLTSSPDVRYRDSRRAVEVATEACELTDWSQANSLETLADACAAHGDFESAVRWQAKAVELVHETAKAAGKERLKQFEARRPAASRY